jgi:hypothetical protein
MDSKFKLNKKFFSLYMNEVMDPVRIQPKMLDPDPESMNTDPETMATILYRTV